MSDSFSKSWHNKAYERLQKIQDAIEEKDTEDQRLLDEEEVEHGNVDDRDDNLEDYRKLEILFFAGVWDNYIETFGC
jgi:hypothetical protein